MIHALVIPAMLLLLGISCLFQNAAFTWSSRSRNSGDPDYHRKAAWASNSVYFITNVIATLYIIKFGGLWMLTLQGLVYTITASEGSVFMMKWLLAREKGKQKPGNQFTEEEAEVLKRVAATAARVIHQEMQRAANAESYEAPQGKDSIGG